MAVREVPLETVEHRPEQSIFFLTYRLDPEDELPIGHVIPFPLFGWKAIERSMDVTHPSFHADVVRIALHEANTEAGVEPVTRQMRRLVDAHAETDWVIDRDQVLELRKLQVRPQDVTGLRLVMAAQDPLPALPRAARMITPMKLSPKSAPTPVAHRVPVMRRRA